MTKSREQAIRHQGEFGHWALAILWSLGIGHWEFVTEAGGAGGGCTLTMPD